MSSTQCNAWTAEGSAMKYNVVRFTPVAFVILLLLSTVLWIIYEEDHTKNWWQLFIAFIFAIFYGYLFSIFKTNCSWQASLALVVIPVIAIAFQLGNINPSTVNPLGFGFDIMKKNNYKPYWE